MTMRIETLDTFDSHGIHFTAHRVEYGNGSCLILTRYYLSTGFARVHCSDPGPNPLAALNATRDLRDWIAGLPPVVPIVEIPA